MLKISSEIQILLYMSSYNMKISAPNSMANVSQTLEYNKYH